MTDPNQSATEPSEGKTPRTDAMAAKPYFSPSEWIESHKDIEAQLTALRKAAEAARVALEAIVKRNAPFGDLQSVSIANAALAELRARLEETK